MLVGGACKVEGNKREKTWDICKSIINKIYIKKRNMVTGLGKGNSRIPDADCETSTLVYIAGLPEGPGKCSGHRKMKQRSLEW